MRPRVHRIVCNGLDHRVFEWGPASEARGTAVLLHGFMDAGSTWDLVAPRLADEASLRVLAPDLRGFGETARVGAGGYYHFPDYVFDVADLVEQAAQGPLFLVGHSMGGTVASLYAGTFPERVTKLALLEGVGPPDNPMDIGPTRFRAWIDQVRALRARDAERAIGSRDDALRRLAVNHPNVDLEILRDRLAHLVREIDAPGGPTLAWKHDPLHKTRSPMPFFAEMLAGFLRQIACPTLFVDGGPTGYHPTDEAARLASLAKLDRVTLDGAGHMMHWTRPAELADALLAFWSAP